MIRASRTRADFAEKFEALIDSYNAGSRSIEELFAELMALSRSLDEEQQRHVREAISQEELVIFDILTRPAPELTADERAEVKKVARELLARLKELLVLDWRKKSGARAQLQLAIQDTLDTGLPHAYTPELYRQKCAAVFEHVYESYPGRGRGFTQGLPDALRSASYLICRAVAENLEAAPERFWPLAGVRVRTRRRGRLTYRVAARRINRSQSAGGRCE